MKKKTFVRHVMFPMFFDEKWRKFIYFALAIRMKFNIVHIGKIKSNFWYFWTPLLIKDTFSKGLREVPLERELTDKHFDRSFKSSTFLLILLSPPPSDIIVLCYISSAKL